MKYLTGPYLFFEGMDHDVTFNGRRFGIILAAAYDVDMSANCPDKNGIAILDHDKKTMLLDEHYPIKDGTKGPSAEQLSEFERVKAMDWEAFSAFICNHPRYANDDFEINQARVRHRSHAAI